MAGWTGLEPATFCVTGRRSNQLSYHPVMGKSGERRFEERRVKRGFDGFLRRARTLARRIDGPRVSTGKSPQNGQVKTAEITARIGHTQATTLQVSPRSEPQPRRNGFG